MFERIECEWPLFFCYLIIDYFFQGDTEAVQYFAEKLEKVRAFNFTSTFKVTYSINIEFVRLPLKEMKASN